MSKKTKKTNDEDDVFSSLNTPEVNIAVTEFDNDGEVTLDYEDTDDFIKLTTQSEEDFEIEITGDDEIEEEKEGPPIPGQPTVPDDDEDEDDGEEYEEDDSQKDESGKKELSRSQKRIIESRNEVKAEKLKRLEAEKQLRQAALERAKAYKMAVDMALENQATAVAAVEAQLKAAMQEGDDDKVIELQKKLYTAQAKVSELERTVPDIENMVKAAENEVKSPSNPQGAPDNDMPEPAKAWSKGKEFIIDNSAYTQLKGEKRIQAAKIRNRIKPLVSELIAEGFDTNDETFYDELDVRLSIEFDFYGDIASLETDNVELDKVSSGETSKKPQEPKKSRAEKQKAVPVKGPSTSSPPNTSPNHSKKKATLPRQVFEDQKRLWNQYFKDRGVSWESHIKAVFEEYNK